MQYDYWKKTPAWMVIVLGIVSTFSLMPILNLIYMGVHNLELGFSGGLSLASLGQLGDFFGGHTAAFAGSLSLLVVLYFTYHQAQQQAHFFEAQGREDRRRGERSFFLEGVGLITQWDINSPGSDQCLRLLDYYGRLALASDDRELLLILNTVITAQIRANLAGRNGSFKRTNYPYACAALEKIAELRKEDGLALKARRAVEKTALS